RTTGFSDLYVVLGDPAADGKWILRAYNNPLAPWIWIGGMVMALGGAISLTDRRLRVGAPVAARAHARPVPAE
uniref:cytochrome c-type biogenesis CcmF C-terminal domain-containing protein n=1 Tax=Salmonella enterica TaxID=28901 RepID=UPI0032984C57